MFWALAGARGPAHIRDAVTFVEKGNDDGHLEASLCH